MIFGTFWRDCMRSAFWDFAENAFRVVLIVGLFLAIIGMASLTVELGQAQQVAQVSK